MAGLLLCISSGVVVDEEEGGSEDMVKDMSGVQEAVVQQGREASN